MHPFELNSFPRKMNSDKRIKQIPTNSGTESGLLNERILLIVFETIEWDIRTLCSAASVSRKLRAVAMRILWRELCAFRAPRIYTELSHGSVMDRLGGGWHALAKLLFFCYVCDSHSVSDHLVKETRFSKTSGRSFLPRRCRGDLLFVSDPCEHSIVDSDRPNQDGLGIFRGVFRGFMRSRTRACLIARRAVYDEKVTCPYCEAPVWSMGAAKLVPRCAARRLGSRDDGLEYFVCVNGHLHGTCWLVSLSSDDEDGGNHDDLADFDDSNDEDVSDETVTAWSAVANPTSGRSGIQ